ncbi:MAG: exosortase/archaeosortase family protein [Bacteroidia bacterium]
MWLENRLPAKFRKAAPYAFVIEIALFMVITYGFHELWWFFATEIKSTVFIQLSADYLADMVYQASYWVNKSIFGLQMTEEGWNVMRFANNKALLVAESCSGLKQFFQVAVLFLLYPGPWRHKLWFIPLGFIAIHLTNIVRVVFLSLWMAHDVPYWDFAHDWIMRPMYYIVIFALWYLWNEYFYRKNLSIVK